MKQFKFRRICLRLFPLALLSALLLSGCKHQTPTFSLPSVDLESAISSSVPFESALGGEQSADRSSVPSPPAPAVSPSSPSDPSQKEEHISAVYLGVHSANGDKSDFTYRFLIDGNERILKIAATTGFLCKTVLRWDTPTRLR